VRLWKAVVQKNAALDRDIYRLWNGLLHDIKSDEASFSPSIS